MIEKFLANFRKPLVPALLAVFVLLALFLHLKSGSFPCLDADEAAFGYNAYSISQTGKDEYGTLLPTRLKSFGDYKLPAITYLTVPFVKVFGLNDFSTRAVTGILGILSPILFYLLAWQLTKNKYIALIAAFLSSVSIWIQTIARQAHEATIANVLLILAVVFFLKYVEKLRIKDFVIFTSLFLIALFSYHTSKGFVLFFGTALVTHLIINKKHYNISKVAQLLVIFFAAVSIFAFTELLTPPSRVQNLFFFQDKGFTLSINELNGEHPSRLLHNKLTYGLVYLTNQYISYFSPEFLVTKGDDNPRFGYKGLTPITVIEYIFLFIGLYYLFKNKEKYRYFILFLLLVSPLTASLAWQEHALTRSFPMIIGLLIIISYGAWHFFCDIQKDRIKLYIFIATCLLFLAFSFSTWDFYLNHYFKRALVVRSWQCGYKDLGTYIKDNYNKYDKFYITRQHGEPYIFLLYYLNYPPATYQAQAKLTPPDKYGFGQVEKFDKFIFSTDMKPDEKGAVMIGYPDDFTSKPYAFDQSRIKKITSGTEDIFWIYESAK